MNQKQLKKLLKKGESENVEFKKSTAQLEKGLKAICAFLNHIGGDVYFGIDRDEVRGQQVSDQTLKSISQKIRQKIKPEITPKITVMETEKGNIIKVHVNEGLNNMYYLNGVPYKRVGTENVIIPPEEIERIIIEKRKKNWDSEICEWATIKNINWEFVNDFFIPKYESLSGKLTGSDKELLEGLGCIKNNKPTNAGILLFGRNPQKFFGSGYISLARYKGTVEAPQRLDYKEFEGNLFLQIDKCDKYIKEHTAIMSMLLPHKVEREDIPEYCWFSIRELIINAVCHREHSDPGSKVIIKMFDNRIEYYNPGGLSVGITPDNITEKQYSRNPIISRVLAKIKYIEDIGEGWNKIIDEHKKHALNPRIPKINADEYSVLVILYSTREKFEKGTLELNKRQKEAIEYTRKKSKITNAEYREINKTTKKTATRDLQGLVKREILTRKGRTGKGVYYVLNPVYEGDIRGHKGTFQ